jgi:hypothetical protein
MNNKPTRFHEIHYRTGKIVWNVEKSPESEFWTAHGRAEIQQEHTYRCKPITLPTDLRTKRTPKQGHRAGEKLD